MSENIMAQFNTEGQPAFPVEDTENDNSADSPSGEETNTDPTQSQEGDENSGANEQQDGDTGEGDDKDNKPFHKDPRWQKREDDWKNRFNDQEKRHADEIQKLREEFDAKYTPKGDNTPSEVPSWFGGDEQEWKEFVEWNNGLVTKAQEDIQKNISAKTEAEKKAIEDATNYMNSEIADIEIDKNLNPEGSKIDRNKLLKFVLDNELVDTQGRWNYKAGWMLMRAGLKNVNTNKIKEKKQIAGATTEKGGADTDKPKFTTSQDFENPANRPW